MDTNQREDHADSSHNESERPRVKRIEIKRLKLVREVIRVSSHLHAGAGCLDTFHTKSYTTD
jgi:hypothetical protein